MKFKLVEKFDETRSMVQGYMYDAMDELNNASLEEYIQRFKSELSYYDDAVEQAVRDAYIEACDYGMIKGVEKTRLTSELKEYIESHTDIIDDTDELMKQCPGHLQHELKIVLSKLDESLNEELLTESYKQLWSQFDALDDLLTPNIEYDLHHIYNADKSLDHGNVNYLILPKSIHQKFPRDNSSEAVKIYNTLKSNYPKSFNSIDVTFEVCNITDPAVFDYLNQEKKHRKSIYNKNRYQRRKKNK